MREIRYRWWNPDKNKMSSWEDICNDPEFSLKEYFTQDYKWLMQFTGLKDKKGKDVYESDIIEYNGNRGCENKIIPCREVVKWKEEIAGFRPAQKKWYENGVEIVGNLHENPELLEEE